MYAAIIDLRNRAQALDDTASRLSARVGSVTWEGMAATAMRSRAAGAITELRRCAQLHLDAAAALERHREATHRGAAAALGGLL